MRVLVVEDEQSLCEIFGEFLQGLGHRPIIVRTAEAAMETIASEAPDAVLLDLNLPGMSGADFLRQPRTRALGVPVVVMSGMATEAEARECMRLGAAEFVGKPVVLEQLGDVLSTLDFHTAHGVGRIAVEAERRRARRVTVSMPVRVIEPDGSEWKAESVDVSVCGIKLRPAGDDITPAPEARLALDLPDSEQPLELSGVLIRQEPDARVYEFVGLTEPQRARLRGVVARSLTPAPQPVERHLTILRTIGQAISKSLAVDEVLGIALDALTHVTGHEISSLHLLSADGASLHLHGERGLSPRLREVNRVLAVGKGLIGIVAATGRTAHYPDVTTTADLLPEARAVVAAEGMRGFVCVPITSRARVLGTLALGRRTADPFTETDIALLEACANQIGLALENARLYEETRRQLDGLKHAESQLMEGERLCTVGKLAAGVAHEINNPLTAILGQAELMLTRSPLPPDARDRLTVIMSETSRAARLLQNLLQLARRQAPERQPCVLEDQVRLVLELKTHDLRRSGIEVRTSFARVPAVLADQGQIRQVLLNLVQNAQQALTGHPGRRELVVEIAAEDRRARVEVRDTGPGIPADVLPRIFDAFFTTKAPGDGTGLGLWVCDSIVEQHQGTLRAENHPDGGAAFVLHLPYARTLRARR
jgi:signal transduction histidine kinase/DNA-binding response OmpR family regulator